jgi:DNA-binding NtrC family response regulator
MQVKLLRVLQEKRFEPVGSNQTIEVDVRVIAATHRPLERMIADGRFREDLYYRLNVITVTLPALRDRADDLLPLAMHFLDQAARKSSKHVTHFEDRALQALLDYDWPGNIRELENTIERAVVLADSDRLSYDDLPLSMRRHSRNGGGSSRASTTPAIMPRPAAADGGASWTGVPDDQERGELLAALERCHGNKAEAARLLGMPRSTYYSKLKKLGLA